jgi:hypothetical protein
MARECGNCGLLSPDTATRCDCGLPLIDMNTSDPGALAIAERIRTAVADAATRNIGAGALMAIAAIPLVMVLRIAAIGLFLIGVNRIAVGVVPTGRSAID